MTEVWFYHLQSQPLERALPALVERAVARGWRVVVQTVDDLRLKAVDDLLWTYKPESFLPHGTDKDPDPSRHPILLTCAAGDNPNGAALRIFIEGAEIGAAPDKNGQDSGGQDLGSQDLGGYERIILLFDGNNDEELTAARRQWSRLKGQGAALAYWQQGDDGRWNRQA